MTRAFISIGSNIDPAYNVQEAIRRLCSVERIIDISTVYRTPAEGRPEQPPYYNCVVTVETSKPPTGLKFLVLRRIEQELGRTRGADKFASRTIDLDLIWYDNLVMTGPDLILPDPQIPERPFLAVPLCEVAPDLVFPQSSMRICDVTARMRREVLEPLKDYTDQLQGEFVYRRKGCTDSCSS